MKKNIALLACVLFLFGCKSETTTNTPKTTNTNQTSANANTNSAANNANQTGNSTVSTTGEKISQPVEVKFEPNSLPPDWKWVDNDKEKPTVYDTKDGVLRLKLTSGKDFFGDNYTSPHLLKAITGDFEIETKVKFDPKTGYQGAGLLIYKDKQNYLRLERGFGGVGGGENGIRLDERKDDGYNALVTQEKFPTEAKEVELRLRRDGNTFTAFWREAGKNSWIEVGKSEGVYPETIQAGLIANNTAEEITAEFSYIKLAPSAKN